MRRTFLLEMRCSECGFRLDPVNESQQVCPACGRDPIRCEAEDGSGIATALADVAALADDLPLPPHGMGEALADDSEVAYLPDPELDLILTDAEAYIKALFEGPILVAGNHLIN
jgi:hypothetical protein